MQAPISITCAVAATCGFLANASAAEPVHQQQIDELRAIKARIRTSVVGLRALFGRDGAVDPDQLTEELLDAPGGYWSHWQDVHHPEISFGAKAWTVPLRLAITWSTPESRFHRDPRVLRAVEDGLRHLLQFAYPGCPQPNNWWAWKIGVPMHLLRTLILLESDLDRDLFQREIETITYLLKAREDLAMTGVYVPATQPATGNTDTNDLWHTRLCLELAVLVENPAMAGKWSARSFGKVGPPGSGHLQADGSFKFHGPTPMWSYGTAFMGDYGALINDYAHTTFGPHPAQLSLFGQMVTGYVNGFLYRGCICPAQTGREITRGEQVYRDFGLAGLRGLAALARSDHPDAEQFRRLARREAAHFRQDPATAPAVTAIMNGIPEGSPAPEVNDTFAYPDTDFLQVTRPGWAVGVKMHSKRNRGYESINDENLQGWFLSHGSMFHLITGDEWRGCWPTIDWKRLPGTTACAQVKSQNESPFAGVVRGSARQAVGAMELRADGFRARKSWIVDGDRIFCLGSDIVGPGRVETTVINQPQVGSSPVIIDGATPDAGPFDRRITATWIWYENVGYVFPHQQTLRILREDRTSDYTSVRGEARHGRGTVRTHSYVTAVIEHDDQQSGYTWVFVPNVKPEDMPGIVERIRHDNELTTRGLHGVRSKNARLDARILWQPGNADNIAANRPCLLLQTQGKWQVVDPTWSNEDFDVTIDERRARITSRDGRPVTVE